MSAEYLTKTEAAKYARVSIATLERLMKGKPPLPHIKLAAGRRGRVLFRKQDIDRWLEKKLIR